MTELRTKGSLTASVSVAGLALAPRGQLVVVGNEWKYGGRHSDPVLVRYTSGGRVDRRATIGLPQLVDAAAVQRDRKILVGGRTPCLLIRRLRADLGTDGAFGERGTVCVSPSDPEDQDGQVRPIVVLPDGRILALLYWLDYPPVGTGATSALVRYRGDGTLDRTFGVGGISTLPFTFPSALALDQNGTILIVGSREPADDSFAVRVSENGVLDRSFAKGGRVVLRPSPTDVLAQPDGKTLIVGESWLARLTSTGGLDVSFGRRGFVTLAGFRARDAAVHRDGDIVVGGSTNVKLPTAGLLIRLDPDGRLDRSFGRSGRVTLRHERKRTTIEAVAVQPDGKVIAAGSAGTRFVIARYHG